MKKQGFLKGSAILLGMVVITKAMGLIYKLPLTHLLGGTGMGYYSSAFAVFTPVFAIVVSGITSTISRTIAENYSFERYANVRKIRRVALLVFSFIGFIVSILFALLSGLLANGTIIEPQARWALIGVAPSIFGATVLSVERGYFEGLKNMLPTAISEIIETIFKLLLGLGFAYLVLDYAKEQYYSTGGCFGAFCRSEEEAVAVAIPYITGASVLGVSLSTCIACLYIIISGKIQGDGITKEMLRLDPITDRATAIISHLFRNAFPVAMATVIATLTNMLDLVTINSCISRAMGADGNLFSMYITENLTREMMPNFIYGSYSGLAVMVSGLVPTFTAMFGKSILPSLSEVWAKGDFKAIQKNIKSMLSIILLIALPAGIGISALSREILEFLFGGRIAEIEVSVIPLKILGLGIVFQAVTIPCFSVLQTIGKSHYPIFISLFGGSVKLILNILLISIPQINICGAAISTVIAQGFICIWSLVVMARTTGLRIDVKNVLLKPLFSAVLCGITARLITDLLTRLTVISINFRISTAISIVLGGNMYLFSLYLLCVLPKNRINRAFFKKNYKNP